MVRFEDKPQKMLEATFTSMSDKIVTLSRDNRHRLQVRAGPHYQLILWSTPLPSLSGNLYQSGNDWILAPRVV